MHRIAPSLAALGLALAPASPLLAQSHSLPADSVLARAMTFRSIGPAVMSGRISDVAVIDAKASHSRLGNVIYAAAATGGVWKSTNAGVTWTSIFDSVRTG